MNATIEVVLYTDVDEGLYTANDICRTKLMTPDECAEVDTISFSLKDIELELIIALKYVVKGEGFSSGFVTARISEKDFF